MDKIYLCDENLEKYSKNKLSKFMSEDELIQHKNYNARNIAELLISVN